MIGSAMARSRQPVAIRAIWRKFGLQGLDGGRTVDAETGEITEAGGAAQ
jgi:hypothetical protein